MNRERGTTEMWTEERLNKMLTPPSEALGLELGRLEGGILVLGEG